jgi:hypothetical protein
VAPLPGSCEDFKFTGNVLVHPVDAAAADGLPPDVCPSPGCRKTTTNPPDPGTQLPPRRPARAVARAPRRPPPSRTRGASIDDVLVEQLLRHPRRRRRRRAGSRRRRRRDPGCAPSKTATSRTAWGPSLARARRRRAHHGAGPRRRGRRGGAGSCRTNSKKFDLANAHRVRGARPRPITDWNSAHARAPDAHRRRRRRQGDLRGEKRPPLRSKKPSVVT